MSVHPLVSPGELVHTPYEFSNFLQWPTNRWFYYEWGSGDTSGSGAEKYTHANDDDDDDDDEEEEEEGKQGECEEISNMDDWLAQHEQHHCEVFIDLLV